MFPAVAAQGKPTHAAGGPQKGFGQQTSHRHAEGNQCMQQPEGVAI